MSNIRHWILVVQDDRSIRDGILIPGLENAGFNTVGVGTVVDAYRCMLSRKFSLLILDSGLPDADSLTLARLRAVTDAGVVVLTAPGHKKDDRERRLAEEKDDADAYMAKPIDVDALAALSRNLLQRLSRPEIPTIASTRTNWRLGAAGWDLISPDGVKVQLSQPERLLIGTLAASSGKTVPRDAIFSLLARDVGNFDRHRLEMLVHRLRRKVLSKTREQLPLKAVRGVGYVLLI